MQLVIAVVADRHAADVVNALVAAGFPGATRINSVGGFLRRGNATLLLGIDDSRVEEAVDVLRSAVEPAEPDTGVSAATIFVAPVRELLHL